MVRNAVGMQSGLGGGIFIVQRCSLGSPLVRLRVEEKGEFVLLFTSIYIFELILQIKTCKCWHYCLWSPCFFRFLCHKFTALCYHGCRHALIKFHATHYGTTINISGSDKMAHLAGIQSRFPPAPTRLTLWVTGNGLREPVNYPTIDSWTL